MKPQRKGTDLKIKINLALHSLGRGWKGATKGLTIAQLESMLRDLTREQIARGIKQSVVIHT